MPKTAPSSKSRIPPAEKKVQTTPHPASTNGAKNDLTELLITGIRELYWIENHLIVQVLPKTQESAGMPALKKALTDHLKVTREHARRLEEIFRLLGLPPQAKKSDGLEGLALEGEGVINSTPPDSDARNAGLIMACQKVENYEITAYKGLSRLATQLGEADIAGLLTDTLAEEQEADDALATIAGKA
jgi:ferritin-like metal-binding protein YciE